MDRKDIENKIRATEFELGRLKEQLKELEIEEHNNFDKSKYEGHYFIRNTVDPSIKECFYITSVNHLTEGGKLMFCGYKTSYIGFKTRSANMIDWNAHHFIPLNELVEISKEVYMNEISNVIKHYNRLYDSLDDSVDGTHG